MASVCVRKETGKLYINFTFMNTRCREQTALENTPANRRKLESLAKKIDAEITLGQFDYASYFPNSKNVEKFKSINNRAVSNLTGCPLFGEWAEDWFNEMSPAWSSSYTKSIQTILKLRVLPAFKDKLVTEITKSDILQFRGALMKETIRDGQHLSPSHVNRHIKVINMLLNEAADRFDFTTPVKNIKPLRVPKSDIKPFNLEEVMSFIEAAPELYRNYYTVRFFTGLRTGEVDGLKWKYVDFEQRIIMVRESYVDGIFTFTKTEESQRDIRMSTPVFDALKAQFEMTGSSSSLVFGIRPNKPLDHNNVTKRVWYPTLEKLGYARRTPYQSRHTAATLWLASGENPEWIARQMGHANTEMLFRVYSRYVPNITHNDGSAFDRMLQRNS